jgi:hypothetical protein
MPARTGLRKSHLIGSIHASLTVQGSGSSCRVYAAWQTHTTAFCCVAVGTQHGGPLKPHNVNASAAQPQCALSHLVDWLLTTFSSIELDVVETRQCEVCANAFLSRSPRLKMLTWSTFKAKERELRRARDNITVEDLLFRSLY